MGVSHGVWSDALTVDWSGEAAEALRTDTHADMMTTSAVVDQLQSAASVARSGASDLDAARSQIRYAVEDARSAGFEVGEDLSVTDRMSGGSAAQRVARQAAAQAFAGNIGGRAAQLVSVDAQVAGRITAAVAGVGNTFPQTPPTNGQVRAVDSRRSSKIHLRRCTPLPVDPQDMTAQEAQAAWAEVNAEIKAWNARCGVENVGPLPPAQYSACMASRVPLLERQAAIRARLGQLGIPVDGEGPAAPAEPGGSGGEPPDPAERARHAQPDRCWEMAWISERTRYEGWRGLPKCHAQRRAAATDDGCFWQTDHLPGVGCQPPSARRGPRRRAHHHRK